MTTTSLLILSLWFFLLSILWSAYWYARKCGATYQEALLVLWREGIVDGFGDLRGAFIPAVKKCAAVCGRLTKQMVEFVVALTRQEPVKHQFTPDLFYGLQAAISAYVYPPFQPIIDVVYSPLPSYVYVGLYTKSAVTEEIKTEVTWAVQAKFQEYMAAYGLDFPFHAVPYVQGNHIEVYLYYADRPVELSAYQAQVKRAMLMAAEPAFKPLTEADTPKSAGFVLGYSLEKWLSSGQVVPLLWDTATANSIIVSGPTGGGKSIYGKLLLEQLLKAGAVVTVCDFKGQGDYKAIKDYAAGAKCDDALARYCADFEKARVQGSDGRRHVLVFDEFGSYAASKDKKEHEALMKMISPLIFMGRSYGYSAILISQRFDAETIKTSLREQFGVKVYMGPSISQQAATMLYPNAEIDKAHHLPPCCGYISTPKVDLDTLIMPMVDIPALDRRLKILGARSNE